MMATGWWWPSSSLPAWLGSEAVWFVALNAVVAAVAILSTRARQSSQSSSSPRRGGAGVTRRASSAVLLQSLRSFSIFSFPSFLQPDAAAFAYQETEEMARRSPTTKPSPRALTLTPPPPPPAPAAVEGEDEDEEDPNAMSMDEAYALVLASRQQRPEREREEEEEARRSSDVDAKAAEFIRGFREDLRQQRIKSIFNYTQMLKQRGLAAGRRPQPDARPDQL